jgi:uridylate kinase
LQSAGNNLAIVVGGGNIWRARDTIDMGIERVVSDHLGMTATIMNAVVLSQLCTKHGLASIVYAPAHHQIPNATHTYEALAARAAMQEGKIILCA